MKFGVQAARHEGRQCPRHLGYIERSGDLKFEYLNGVENAENFKSKAFSEDSGRESAVPSMICNPYR
jgi:hypothetical protein